MGKLKTSQAYLELQQQLGCDLDALGDALAAELVAYGPLDPERGKAIKAEADRVAALVAALPDDPDSV